jgi:putative flippase GtrA
MKNTNPLVALFHVFGRFSLVGIIATFIYFISANLLIYTNIVSPIIASSIAFIITMPISFLGHRNFTFQAGQNNISYLKRYLCYAIIGFACSNLIIFLTTLTSLINAYIGVAMVTLVLPIINFLALKFFVFYEK